MGNGKLLGVALRDRREIHKGWFAVPLVLVALLVGLLAMWAQLD